MTKRLIGAALIAAISCSPAGAQDPRQVKKLFDSIGRAAATKPSGNHANAVALKAAARSRSEESSADTLDIAGMKLDMTPLEIRAAMVKAGFTPRAKDPDQPSWEARVSTEVAKRRSITPDKSKEPLFTMARGPRGERIEVWYHAGPQGARASSISYSMPAAQITRADFRKGVLAKYGNPTAGGYGKNSLYCTPEENECAAWKNKRKAYLEVEDGFSSYGLALRSGMDASEAVKAALQAEVDRRAPRDATPSF